MPRADPAPPIAADAAPPAHARVWRSSSTPWLVGRAREVARVDAFIDAIPARSGALFIVGEAGIGKTTLWSHGLRRARAAGFRVFQGRACAADVAPAVSGLTGLFGVVGDPTGPGPVRSSRPPGDAIGHDDRYLVDMVDAISAEVPVLLAIDDFQLLDVAAARTVRRLLHQFEQRPVALLAAARSWSPGDSAATPPAPSSHTERLDVGPMPIEDLRQLLASVTDAPVSRPELARIHRLTGGNPMFAVETARTWRREGAWLAPGSPMDALARRVRELPSDSLEVARCVAIAGPAPAALVAGAVEVSDLRRAAREAEDAGVLMVDDDFTVRFTHPLFATAALLTVNALDRQTVHRRLAELVADPHSRIRHRARSIAGDEEATASDLEVVAEQAARRGATDVAADDFAQSARLTPAGHVTDWSRRVLSEATNRAACGQTATAVQLVDAVLEVVGPGGERAEALTQRVFLDFGDSEQFLEEALRCTADTAGRARVLDLLGWQLGLYRGRLAAGLAKTTEALALARSIDERELTMVAAATQATISLLLGRPQPDLMAEAVALADTLSLPRLGRWPRVFRARQHLWNGFLAEARADFDEMRRVATTLGSEFQRPYRLYDQAMLELAAGDLELARCLAREGLDAAIDAGNEQATVWLAYPLGMAGAHQGDDTTALWAAERLEWWATQQDEPPRRVMADDIRGTAAASAGDWSAALEHYEVGAATLEALGYRHPGVIAVLPRAIDAACVVGNADRARRHLERLQTQARGLDAPWVHTQATYSHGALLLLEGQPDQAIEHLDSATAAMHALGYRLDAARMRPTQIRAHLHAGHRSTARALLRCCRDELTAIAATRWVTTVDRQCEAASTSHHGTLTATETQLARLVMAGLRNREIAAELYISVSTVEAHLTRIYRKVGVRSRTELVQLLAAEDFARPPCPSPPD